MVDHLLKKQTIIFLVISVVRAISVDGVGFTRNFPDLKDQSMGITGSNHLVVDFKLPLRLYPGSLLWLDAS